jgi:hypothetical protein
LHSFFLFRYLNLPAIRPDGRRDQLVSVFLHLLLSVVEGYVRASHGSVW